MTIQLRDYQDSAVRAVMAAHDAGVRRPAVVLPTGAGKTVVIAELVRRHHARPARAGGRTLVIAHRTELIEQAAEKLRRQAPDLRVGIVKAERDQARRDVIVASVQTLASAARRGRVQDVDLVIVDECHHATATSYLRVLEHYGCMEERGVTGAMAVGFTATMVRADQAALGDVWQEVVATRSIVEMISDGYLVEPRGYRVEVPDLNLSKVRKSRGDYAEGALGEAIEQSLAPELVAKSYLEHADGLQGILFAPTVATAELYAEAMRGVGVTSAVVHGKMDERSRRGALDSFRSGETQLLSNCAVLTEGTDLPMASVCVVGRPTKSQGLYVQMVGRVLRPHPGKTSAIVLDVSGASERHSLMPEIDLFGEDDLEPATEEVKEEGELEDPLTDEDAEPEPDEADDGQVWYSGPVRSREIDLFAARRSVWMHTYAGIWFIPAGDRYIIVQRGASGGWDVIEMHKFQPGRSSWVVQGVSDLGTAMTFAEGNVKVGETMTALKGQRWRRQDASDRQRALAARYGVIIPEVATAGMAAELITVAMASARIDPLTPAYARRREA